MSIITCTRHIAFDAAHRVLEHESQCKYLHGHRYNLEASFTAPKLDSLGRIIDFGVIKMRLGGWVDQYWDHNTILDIRDQELGASIEKLTGRAVFFLPNNPTAENLVHYLFESICPALFPQEEGIICQKLRLYETPNCYAEIY